MGGGKGDMQPYIETICMCFFMYICTSSFSYGRTDETVGQTIWIGDVLFLLQPLNPILLPTRDHVGP